MNPWPFVIAAYARRHCADRGAAAVVIRVDAPSRSGGRRAQAQMKPKNQRLVLVVAAVVAVLRRRAARDVGPARTRRHIFYTPADIAAGKAA